MAKLERELANGHGGARAGAGRKKGVPNRRSWDMRLQLEASGFEPVTELVTLLRATTDPALRMDRLMQLMPYLYPRLKNVETPPATDSGEDDDEADDRSTEELLAIAMRPRQ